MNARRHKICEFLWGSFRLYGGPSRQGDYHIKYPVVNSNSLDRTDLPCRCNASTVHASGSIPVPAVALCMCEHARRERTERKCGTEF